MDAPADDLRGRREPLVLGVRLQNEVPNTVVGGRVGERTQQREAALLAVDGVLTGGECGVTLTVKINGYVRALMPVERKWLKPRPAVNPAQRIIAKFGGQTGLAKLLGKPQSSIEYWSIHGSIPGTWRTAMLDLAKLHDIALSEDDHQAWAIRPVEQRFPHWAEMNPARRTIARFGSHAAFARLLGKSTRTVDNWAVSGRIPPSQRNQIRNLANECGIVLLEDDDQLWAVDERRLTSRAKTNPARRIFANFGSHADLARLLGKSESSIHYWSVRGSIPTAWRPTILDLAKQRGITLSEDDRQVLAIGPVEQSGLLRSAEKNPTQRIIEKFGSQRGFAKLLGIRRPAVRHWVLTGRIPHIWRNQILSLAKQQGIALSEDDDQVWAVDQRRLPGRAEMNPARRIIGEFGGQRRFAMLLGKPKHVIEYWSSLGSIPVTWRTTILDLAKQHGIALSEDHHQVWAINRVEHRELPRWAEMNPARRIIKKFGRQSRLAKLLGKSASTVRHWATSGWIPHIWRNQILDLARQHGIALSEDEFGA